MSVDRYVMRHPDTGGVGLVPASAVVSHKGRGWLRVSDAIPEHDVDHVDVSAYANAPDLDAQPVKPATKSPAKPSEENT